MSDRKADGVVDLVQGVLRQVNRSRATAVGLALVGFLGVGSSTGSAQAPATPPAGAEKPAVLLVNERHPLPGTMTGGVPADVDVAGTFRRLADAGARTFIDLRTDAEVTPETRAAALAAGLDYTRLPVGGEVDLDLGTVRALDALLGDWSRYPVVIACASGNRAGALLALRAFWLGGTRAEDALALGQAAGLTKLEPSVRLLLGLPPMIVAAAAPVAPARQGAGPSVEPAESMPSH
jgi:protein tyrosine phosphatase (PTP) superfamily phosphohydrolase (DUF442 family)